MKTHNNLVIYWLDWLIDFNGMPTYLELLHA